MSEKEKFRKTALQMRSQAYLNDDGMAARIVASKIIMLPELDHYKSVSGYHTIKDEMDCIVTLKVLHAAQFDISLPAIVSNKAPLEFRSWNMRSALSSGPFGTLEPKGEAIIPEVIIAPLLAFDEKGARLGYGGGYYDRTIAKLRNENPDIVVIGIAYDCQKLDAVPVESYDQSLNIVVTEKETYRFD